MVARYVAEPATDVMLYRSIHEMHAHSAHTAPRINKGFAKRGFDAEKRSNVYLSISVLSWVLLFGTDEGYRVRVG